jgi:hypothetical protein
MTLPRETNLPRVLSFFRRTLRLVRKARADAKARAGNVGADTRRRERTLAAWSVSRKVAFMRARSAKRSVLKAARAYHRALAAWQSYYNGTTEA